MMTSWVYIKPDLLALCTLVALSFIKKTHIKDKQPSFTRIIHTVMETLIYSICLFVFFLSSLQKYVSRDLGTKYTEVFVSPFHVSPVMMARNSSSLTAENNNKQQCTLNSDRHPKRGTPL